MFAFWMYFGGRAEKFAERLVVSWTVKEELRMIMQILV